MSRTGAEIDADQQVEAVASAKVANARPAAGIRF